jgi:drug/metabolite transporter (DMT)-like permease
MIKTKDITPSMRRFPQFKFAIMGFLDTSFNLLSTFPQPHLGGAITNVMTQVVLPFNMIGSMLFLGTRFKRVHYVGSILVVYGVLVNLMPFFEGRTPQENTDPSIGWILINALACVFAAASNVYKEIALKDEDLDVWYANAWEKKIIDWSLPASVGILNYLDNQYFRFYRSQPSNKFFTTWKIHGERCYPSYFLLL